MSQEKQGALTTEVGTLRRNCSQLEKAMVELQGSLESKNASLTSLSNDLKVSEEQYNRLMVKVEELQNTTTSRENAGDQWRAVERSTFKQLCLCFLSHQGFFLLFFFFAVHDLRQQMAALQGQLQQVQLERNTLQSRLKTSQAEIDSLQQVRQWYQQQLALAQEARVRLQSEMANMQVGVRSVAGNKEHIVMAIPGDRDVFLSLKGWADDAVWGHGTPEAGKRDAFPSTDRDPTPLH